MDTGDSLHDRVVKQNEVTRLQYAMLNSSTEPTESSLGLLSKHNKFGQFMVKVINNPGFMLASKTEA